jgi:hypothetical protein
MAATEPTTPAACGHCGGRCTNGAECAISQFLGKPLDWTQPDGIPADAYPFPLAAPTGPPDMIIAPCGCTSMVTEPGAQPMQVSWCVRDDPGYEPPRRADQ